METKEKILEFLKNQGKEPTTIKDIINFIKISYPTISKYLLVLEAEGKIKVSNYGNIKFYYFKNEN